VKLDYDLENTPLQIKTDSEVGSNEQMAVNFLTAQEKMAGGVRIIFASTVLYELGSCSIRATVLPTTLPSTKEKVFRITLSRTSGIRLKIECNEEEILNVLMSDTTCSKSHWSTIWSEEVKKIRFNNYDTASDYYLTYSGE
jgi:hypothetical protein